MTYIKNCLACGREIQGQISKLFCKDACRKRFKRKGGILPIEGLSKEHLNEIKKIADETDNSEQVKDTDSKKKNVLEQYFFKKVIDIGASVIETHLKEGIKNKNTPGTVTPLVVQSGTDSKSNALPCNFSPEMMEFLGKISYPFKILVWGLPGEGKSTFCMKLADEISKEYNLLYVMAEENLNSETLLDKKQRTLTSERNRKVSFVNRLPISEEEWKGLILEDKSKLKYSTLVYDSVTKMNITPFYIDQAAGLYKMKYFKDLLSHIFVTHAHKDGAMYRGDGSWAHEVDIVVRCKQGIAYTEKNRFGIKGKDFKIY